MYKSTDNLSQAVRSTNLWTPREYRWYEIFVSLGSFLILTHKLKGKIEINYTALRLELQVLGSSLCLSAEANSSKEDSL